MLHFIRIELVKKCSFQPDPPDIHFYQPDPPDIHS